MRVHDSQAYRKIDATRERIGCILELTFQTGFNLINAAVVCVILESIPGLEFEDCDCLKLQSVYFDLFVDATGVVYHQLGLLRTDLHAIGCGSFVKMLN